MTMTEVDPRFERLMGELFEYSRQKSEVEDAEREEASARRELAYALENLDPEWSDPAKVRARVRELDLVARPLLDAFALVYREMRWVELRGLWAATVDAQGDTDVAGAIWHEQYGAEMVTRLNRRLSRLPDSDPDTLHEDHGDGDEW